MQVRGEKCKETEAHNNLAMYGFQPVTCLNSADFTKYREWGIHAAETDSFPWTPSHLTLQSFSFKNQLKSHVLHQLFPNAQGRK